MLSFLEQCAEYIATSHQQRIAQTCLVLPTARSGRVLKGYLKKHGVIDLPEILAIDEFVAQFSGLETTVSVMQLLELFDVFSQVDKELKLEKFTGWGYILLKDFDSIDRSLVDAHALFENLKDIKQIERWRLGEENATPRIQEYFKLWENLETVYHGLRAKLLAQNQGYTGMLYRYLAENAEEILVKHPHFQYFIFVGFNALSKAEEEIFRILYKEDKAEIIWDADVYYLENEENKAGLFMREYAKRWAGTNWHFQGDNLLRNHKKIITLSVANASMQGKVANQLLKNWTIQPKTEEDVPVLPATALVLADEHLLMPVLHSLDTLYTGANITIGLSLKDSALFTLIDTLFEQQQMTIRHKETDTVKFNHRTVFRLLNHSFVRQFERKKSPLTPEGGTVASQSPLTPKEGIAVASPFGGKGAFLLQLILHFTRANVPFIGLQEMLDVVHTEEFIDRVQDSEALEYCQYMASEIKPLFETLFKRWRNTFEIVEGLEELLALLYSEENHFEAAYFKEFTRILKQLRFFVEKKPKFIDMRTFRVFLYQAFRETKFDFDSQKDTDLQVMGITETRNLDYDNVIILSVNETVLPRGKKHTSFLPVDIARSYGIPTYHEQDAVVSYHFYRLLQRAKQVAMVYVLPSDTYGGKEKSRFILQIANDLVRFNPRIAYSEQHVRFRNEAEENKLPMEVVKDDHIRRRMKAMFAEGITPSQINTYVSCSLQYYFNEILRAMPVSKIEERMGQDKLGELIHEVLEDVYVELATRNPQIQPQDIEATLPTIKDRVMEKFMEGKYVNYELTGENFIVKESAITNIEEFLKSQIEEIHEKREPFHILALENKEAIEGEGMVLHQSIAVTFPLEVEQESLTVTLRGRTDRIDKIKQKVRIIDYKTGKVERKHLQITKEDLDKLVHDREKDKVRQLWLYKYIIAKQILEQGSLTIGEHTLHENTDLRAGIYSFRNLKDGFLELNNKDNHEIFPENLREYVHVSEDYLSQILQNMLDKSQKFERTDDIDVCKYCAHKDTCGR
jgi:hypothetical protein